MGQPVGLLGKIMGDASIEPALDLGGQIENLDGHGGIPLHFRRLAPPSGGKPAGHPTRGVECNIGHLADRFQYLSVNNP
jgi:hypothetical protein